MPWKTWQIWQISEEILLFLYFFETVRQCPSMSVNRILRRRIFVV